MRHLHKIFHESSPSDFEKLYSQRYSFDSTVHTDLSIKPMNQSRKYELYYVPSNKMLDLINRLYSISKEFDSIFNELPKIAQKQFLTECIVNELFHTNELEGIRSSKEEISRSTRDVISNKKSKKRFESMIKSYLHLLNNTYQLPQSAQEIRHIYDEITRGEIEQQELPDGEIFRKEVTFILKKSGSGKIIHQGIIPEEKIVNLIENLLKFLNKNQDIPNIIKVAISHYYFGYIHPFYDGNGRTARFISSIYLAKDLGNVISLSVSRGCNVYKNKYLEAFEITNSIRSRGELNYFIETFIEIIVRSLEQMSTELKEKNQLLFMARKKLTIDPKLKQLTAFHQDLVWVLTQNHFFDSSNGLTTQNLAQIFSKSEATIRKILKELLHLPFIIQEGERPSYFRISQQYFEEE